MTLQGFLIWFEGFVEANENSAGEVGLTDRQWKALQAKIATLADPQVACVPEMSERLREAIANAGPGNIVKVDDPLGR